MSFPKKSNPEYGYTIDGHKREFYVKDSEIHFIRGNTDGIFDHKNCVVDFKNNRVANIKRDSIFTDCSRKFMNTLLYFGTPTIEEYELEKQFENLSTKEIEEIDDELEKEYVDALGTEEVEEEWNLLFGRRRRPRSTRTRR